MQRYIVTFLILMAGLLWYNHTPALELSEFSGLVVDLDNKPVERAEIFLYTSDNIRRPADFISAGTDTAGHFRMTLPVGKYWAVARVRKGEKFGPLRPGDKHSGEPVVFEIAAGQPAETVFTVVDLAESARLSKKTSSDFFRIRGKIIDEQGSPIQPAYAIANRHSTFPPTQIADFISAWTDADGHYLLFLPAGKFHIGWAQTFPAQRSIISSKEIAVTSHLENIDIVVKSNTLQNPPANQTNDEDNQ